jgi:hypothetical protein
VQYDEFKREFLDALRASGLPVLGGGGEVLDLRSMDRTFTVYVEPIGFDCEAPLHVSASISWRWSSVQTARVDDGGSPWRSR